MTVFRFGVASLTLLLLGCAGSTPSELTTSPSPAPPPQVTQATQYGSFAAWKQDFMRRAVAQGLDTQMVSSIMANARYQPSIARLDGEQPEFSKHIWSYLDSALSAATIRQGQKQFRETQWYLLRGLEHHYGVPAEVITAIWGLETAYGANTGNSDLPSALSTLAYDGRRRAFAEMQLLALIRLVTSGDVGMNQLRGSWAGGMGQTQFIPTTYEEHAVDDDGDGRRNLWQRADALASTASYLSHAGWQRGIPWGIEVNLPAGFRDDYIGQRLTWAEWQKLGVRALPHAHLPEQANAILWLPAGKDGPALLTTANFDVIKVYNNASSYALAVSLLSDAIAGRPTLQAAWPRDAKPLSRNQVMQLQQRLHALGYDTGEIDGILGANTRAAFRQWQHQQGVFADGFISQQNVQELLR